MQRSADFRCLFVRKVTERAAHPALEARRVRSGVEHCAAVVRFEKDHFAAPEKRTKLTRRMTDVGGNGDALLSARNANGYLGGVVGDGERLDEKWPEFLGATRRVRPHFGAASRTGDGRGVMCKERSTERTGERQGVRRVVAVVVSHEDPERRSARYQLRAERSHSFGRACRADAGVDDQPLARRFDDEAVAARAATEDEDTHEADYRALS